MDKNKALRRKMNTRIGNQNEKNPAKKTDTESWLSVSAEDRDNDNYLFQNHRTRTLSELLINYDGDVCSEQGHFVRLWAAPSVFK